MAVAIENEPARLGWKTVVVATLFYSACVAVATFPVVANFRSALAGSLFDPLQHLWIMKWYRSCLLEGRSPLICRELQYPIGAPIGNFSPLHFQAMLFLALSTVIRDDVTLFNTIWLFGMVTTGLGTMVLAFGAVRDRACSVFAGMLAMLSAPMMLHGRAHLELIHLGCFPLFLAGWMRFVDRPSRGRLASAIGLYLLATLCAAYYAVFAAIPASLYVVWKSREDERGLWRGLASRMKWLAAFAGVVVPVMVGLFWTQIWSIARGFSSSRSIAEFDAYSAPPWTFFTPTSAHRVSSLLPADLYHAAGYSQTVGERASYLGIVTIALAIYAARTRATFRRSGFLWATLAVMVILAWGGVFRVGDAEILMPAGIMKRYFPLFSMIRVPSRFNLFVAVVAAVIAAAGLKRLLGRIPGRGLRGVAFASLALAAMADLHTGKFDGAPIPAMPVCYGEILRRDPHATFLELPQYGHGGDYLSSVAGYWQSIHRARTSAGYSGSVNLKYDDRAIGDTPFRDEVLRDPDSASGRTRIGIVEDVTDLEYTYLYLAANDYRYVILHRWEGSSNTPRALLDRIAARLAPGKVFEDSATLVFDREKLPRPGRAAAITADGWRPAWADGPIRAVGRSGRIVVYNPDATKPVEIALDASAAPNGRPREVRLLDGGRELARWTVAPGRRMKRLVTPPLNLPEGLTDLFLESDAEARPRRPEENASKEDARPFSLRVATVKVEAAPGTLAGRPGPGSSRTR